MNGVMFFRVTVRKKEGGSWHEVSQNLLVI
jgi:hypothetical protein